MTSRVPGYPGTCPFCGNLGSLFFHNISRNPIRTSVTQSTSTAERVGSDLNTRGNTRGNLEPADNGVTGTPVPTRFAEARFVVLP